MEFRHLKTFQTVLQSGSFLQAAEQLQYAQSTITLHIQQLEAELGVKVFQRQGKKLQLTSAGRALENHASSLLHRAELLNREMLELVAGTAGHLRIGSIEPVASLRLPKLLAEFCQQYPQVRLTLETGVTETISQGVAEGKLDLAICSPPRVQLGLNFEVLFNDPMTLLIPANHKLSQQEAIAPQDLAAERLLLTEANCPYRKLFEREIATRGVSPDAGLEIMSLKVLEQMVVAGLGIGVMPTAVISPAPKNTVVKQICDLPLELPVGLAIANEKSIPGLALDRVTKAMSDGLKSD